MKHISDLFERHLKNIKPPQASVEKEFITTCAEVAHITLKPEQCTFTVGTKTIYLTAPSLLKSEIQKNKREILSTLKAKLGTSSPTEII